MVTDINTCAWRSAHMFLHTDVLWFVNMPSKLILFILPVIVVAKIHIDMSGNFDDSKDPLKPKCSGSHTFILTEGVRKAFQISDENLKKCVAKRIGKPPDHTFVAQPTPWGDLYKLYGWDPISVTVKPISAVVLETGSESQIIMQHEISNPDDFEAVYTTGIEQKLENTFKTTSTSEHEFSTEAEVSFKANIGVVESSARFKIGHTYKMGTATEKSETVSTTTTSQMEIQMKPGQTLLARMVTSWHSLKLEVTYSMTLSGEIAINYNNGYRNHHYWAMYMEDCLRLVSLPTEIKIKEEMQMGFYGKTNMVLKDANKVKTKT